MNLQSAITLCIEIIFWLLVIVMITDFVNGLFDVWYSQTLAPVSVIVPQLEEISQPDKINSQTRLITVNKPQFEAIPDPWELPTASEDDSPKTQSNVLPFPILRLLPPAKEVQPKSSRTTKKPTTTKPKSAKSKSPQKPGRPRKKAA